VTYLGLHVMLTSHGMVVLVWHRFGLFKKEITVHALGNSDLTVYSPEARVVVRLLRYFVHICSNI
jgi:hypothetical protein